MSGFDTTWLALREPADLAARDAGLMEAADRYLLPNPSASILDIGCGTGSTWRGLSQRWGVERAWLLLDHDPQLLAEAQRRIGKAGTVDFRLFDLNAVADLPLAGVGLVTASALLDLCSERFCVTLAQGLAAARCGLYAALNYDGMMQWSVKHPLDAEMVALFNRHQRSDKELGMALGPDATACMADCLARHDFEIAAADSPWRLDEGASALQVPLLQGLRQPLLEAGNLAEEIVDEWLAFRLEAIMLPGSTCMVGHKDLLALPR
jgi:SAM-dependent methyltransferase